jgi:hypothetical protein
MPRNCRGHGDPDRIPAFHSLEEAQDIADTSRKGKNERIYRMVFAGVYPM